MIFISLCIAAFCLAPRCLSFYRIILSSSAAFSLSLANPNIPTSPPCCSDFTSPDPFLFSPRLVRQGLVTGSDDGSIAIYEKSEDKDLFRRTKARRRCPPPTPPPATRGGGLSVEGRRQSPPLSGKGGASRQSRQSRQLLPCESRQSPPLSADTVVSRWPRPLRPSPLGWSRKPPSPRPAGRRRVPSLRASSALGGPPPASVRLSDLRSPRLPASP